MAATRENGMAEIFKRVAAKMEAKIHTIDCVILAYYKGVSGRIQE
jgi:hypothetical protein